GGAEDRNGAHHQPPCPAQPSTSSAETASTAPDSASKRSMKPPWPGIRFELSLTPARRLSQLSAMSPICPARQIGTPASASHSSVWRVARPKPRPPPPPPAQPATGPDQVFLGKMRGQNFGPP